MRNVARSSGQALVLVLLSLAVVLTLVLFILSRTISDIAVSTSEEEAIRAFSAAEAGVEKALIVGSISETNIGDAKFSGNVTGFAAGTPYFNYPVNLASGDTAIIWFVDHDANGNVGANVFSGSSMKVCWGKEATPAGNGFTPAVEISVFYNDGAVKIGRATFDPNSGRRSTNLFDSAFSNGCTIDGVKYQFYSTVNFAGLGIADRTDLLFAKLRIFYNTDQNHKAGFDVSGQGVLPSQGLDIESLGISGSANRKLEVFQGWPEAPGIFDYTIYSNNGLIKQ